MRPDPDQLVDLWRQLTAALLGLARRGLAHGDLSAYNLLVHDGRLVMIDLPQVVDVVGNPQGPRFLERDVRRIAEWFAARGLPPEVGGADGLLDELRIASGHVPACQGLPAARNSRAAGSVTDTCATGRARSGARGSIDHEHPAASAQTGCNPQYSSGRHAAPGPVR